MKPSVEDRLDIIELLARYARALDSGDSQALAETFAVEGTLHLPQGGVYTGEYVGRARIKEFGEAFKSDPAFPGGQHFVSQIVIDGGPDRCEVSSYVMRTLRMPNGTTSIYFLGQYEDVCIKEAGCWVFHSRRVRRWGS